MESQSKTTSKGSPGAGNGTGSSPMQLLGYVFRVLAILLTLISAIVMGAAKETQTAVIINPITLGEVIVSATAKSTYSSAFVFFIVVNSVAFVYSAMSLVVSIANRSSSGNLLLPLAMADVIMVALLFASDGAATAFGIIAEKGNSHAQWAKFCDSAKKFCGHIVASIVLSMLASVAYVVLAMLGISGLHKRSSH